MNTWNIRNRNAKLPIEERFWEKVAKGPEDECWIWLGYMKPNGYGQFTMKHGKCVNASRASYLINKGEIPDGMEVCHTCDNGACVNPNHLFLGTHKENMKDCENKGRQKLPPPPAKGSKNHSSKLTEKDVKKIIELRMNKGATIYYLGQRFGVSPQAIMQILSGEHWSQVTGIQKFVKRLEEENII